MRADLLLAVPALLSAHNYPLTHGTLQAAPGGLRFTLRLPLHHFHPALEAHAGRRIVLKDGEVYAPADLEAYFQGRLELEDAGARIPFQVVSQSVEIKDLVVVLEAAMPQPQRCALRNRILFETSSRHQNLVTVEGLGPRRGLVFDTRHPVLPLVP